MSSTQARTLTETIAPGISFDMILVEGGSFMMGGRDGEVNDSEKPVHEVKVSSFYIGKYQLTQQVYEAIIKENPSIDKGENRPVENVSWNDAKKFIQKLNVATGKNYRLPSEAEWEFAARGGNYSEDYIYAGSDEINEVAWYEGNEDEETHVVGEKMGNELGLFDMSGNVWEWCEDDWHDDYKDAPIDGSAWLSLKDRGRYRVYRGGGSFNNAHWCRVAYRRDYSLEGRRSDFGFRLVLPVQ